jgi:RNA polymerase sigma-70 factor (ECF subfamily)
MEPDSRGAGVTSVSTTRPADEVAAFYAATYQRLVGVVALAAGGRAEAEEVVQEAFVRLLGRWPTVSRYDDPEAWVRAVAFRLMSNRRRKAVNGLRALVRHGAARDVDSPSSDHVDVMRALRSLPLAHRQVVVLHYLVGMSVEDVAASLQIAPGTVKSRLSRARDALAPLLREEIFHA